MLSFTGYYSFGVFSKFSSPVIRRRRPPQTSEATAAAVTRMTTTDAQGATL